ncbi:lysophospholipase [Scopulibacillus darangshiensis]|uniref:Lysophospholipase n=1 Tax=Scopulibacillus darangshiensis TaxID=442528 RepID=A0A4R2NX03_9BACL|nr:alpha/beta hydrolase [Scopulibacillus darangshiensis]TCP26640.1 lysophospholipase [Scopulibacillus darangshiensis]
MAVWETKQQPLGVIVIVHGSGEHIGRYHWLREKWLNAGFHVVMGDLPGHGEKAAIRGHIDNFKEYLDVIESWVERASAFRLPICILGHSLGGLAVIRTLQERDLLVTGVMLSSPCLGLKVPVPKWLRAVGAILNRTMPRFLVPTKKSADNMNATRNLDMLRRDAKDTIMLKKVSARWYFELEKAMLLAFERLDAVPNIPLLILQGGDDKIVEKNSVKRWFDSLTIENKAYKEWPNLYHEVFNEPEREDVFQEALKFVKPLQLGGRHK